ncbi:MAG: hypothetical protein LBT97_11845 [Planctomycetota bacterium]|jgi:TPR repeat protein|nr:hypothetical protein [Planctomycetota bacterium]
MDDYHVRPKGLNPAIVAVAGIALLALAGGGYFWHLHSRPTLEKARSLFAAGNAPAAVEMYTRLANEQNIAALKELGNILYNGNGVPVDREHGIEYLRSAALDGDLATQIFLGDLYYDGLASGGDLTSATIFLRLAADNGHADSAAKLAALYHSGRGMARNYGEAVKYFKQAADAGDVDASVMLGRMYLLGEGVDNDFGKAKSYLGRADGSQDPELRNRVGAAYYEAGAPDLALDHLLFASLHGVDDATFLLGRMYYYGEGVRQSYEMAADCLLPLAGRTENIELLVMLGRMNYFGHGVEQNYTAARTYLEMPARLKHPMAMGLMGAMLVRGLGGEVDMALGLHYLRNALDEGDVTAMSAMGELHYYGRFVPFDRELALDYLTKAAVRGDEDAKRILGYYDGILAQQATREREALERQIASRRHEVELLLIEGMPGTTRTPWEIQREINRLEFEKRQRELRAQKEDAERLREFEMNLEQRQKQNAPPSPALSVK